MLRSVSPFTPRKFSNVPVVPAGSNISPRGLPGLLPSQTPPWMQMSASPALARRYSPRRVNAPSAAFTVARSSAQRKVPAGTRSVLPIL